MPNDIGAHARQTRDDDILVDRDGASPAETRLLVIFLGMIFEYDRSGPGLAEGLIADGADAAVMASPEGRRTDIAHVVDAFLFFFIVADHTVVVVMLEGSRGFMLGCGRGGCRRRRRTGGERRVSARRAGEIRFFHP